MIVYMFLFVFHSTASFLLPWNMEAYIDLASATNIHNPLYSSVQFKYNYILNQYVKTHKNTLN